MRLNVTLNALFGQLHGVKTDAAGMVALPLHGNVKPILLLHGIALALVVASGVSLVGLFPGDVMESLAQDDSARRASDGSDGVAVGKFVAEICAARAKRGVVNGSHGGAAHE